MSKRSSLNAKRFAGKSWKLKPLRKHENSSYNKVEAAKNRQRKKTQRIEKQFESICKKFDINENDEKSKTLESLKFDFCKIKKSKKRIKALQGVKSYRLYCKKYNEDFSIETYFRKEYYLVNYKKDFPDVYYFNVYPQKK